jgi:hypothetical protein
MLELLETLEIQALLALQVNLQPSQALLALQGLQVTLPQ